MSQPDTPALRQRVLVVEDLDDARTSLCELLETALGLLLLRSLLSQMDVPARASYVMAVVTPEERTAAASFTAVPRSLASAISPAIAGALFAAGHEAWPFIICGVLKTAYDLALLYTFRNAFGYFKNGYASAMAWSMFVVILLLTFILFRTQKRWVYYEVEGEE